MKWVKLSDREPIPNGNPIIIKIYDGDNILDVFWVTNHIHLVEDWSRYEWLDESEEVKISNSFITNPIEESFQKAVAKEIMDYEGAAFGIYSKSLVDKLLIEQHRNTRHDAAEAVMNYIVDTDCFLDSSAIHTLVMNLKQRKP